MAMKILRVGSTGGDVKKLQEALNQKLKPSLGLVPDGIFGGLTKSAVVRFQSENWLVIDGDVGPCTWNAVMDTETYKPVLHTLPFIPQPTPTTCWAASTAMITKSTVPAVIAKTPADLIASDGGLKNYSNTNDAVTNSQRYAKAHFLRFHPPMSWLVSALRAKIQQGPLMFDMLWDAGGYVSGVGSPGHMIVVVGVRGDDDESGLGTTLRIYDPWPPTVGKKYSVGYNKWINEVPTRTYRTFHKA